MISSRRVVANLVAVGGIVDSLKVFVGGNCRGNEERGNLIYKARVGPQHSSLFAVQEAFHMQATIVARFSFSQVIDRQIL